MEKIPDNPYNSMNATNRDLYFLLTKTKENEKSVSIDEGKALQTAKEYLEILNSDEELDRLRSEWICSNFSMKKEELIQKIQEIIQQE